jgi:cytochrome c-type biogenesis protein CcmH/NrfF
MKNFLQDLVDRGLSNEQIDRAMVEKYGEEVLLFLPDTAGTPGG